MAIRSPVQIYGFFFPSLVIRLCREARLLENKTTNRKVKREKKCRADKFIIGKEPGIVKEGESEYFDGPIKEREVHMEDVGASATK